MNGHHHNMNQIFLQRLTEITEENLTNEHFNVNDLASAMNMSHTKLYRKLKSLSHQTISQFIREIRLRKAQEILLKEDVTASEIAYRTGFGSPTYFNKCFHEYYGYSPLEFKKREIQKRYGFVSSLSRKLKSKIHYFLIIIALAIIAALFFFALINHDNSDPEKSHSHNKVIISSKGFNRYPEDNTVCLIR